MAAALATLKAFTLIGIITNFKDIGTWIGESIAKLQGYKDKTGDEFYYFVSGGFSGQLAAYGIPSGRLLRVIPVYSVNPENGCGYTEESKPMLMTSYGFIPWDDSHHSELSQTDGIPDGRWVFINGNNTPRIARIDLKTFKTAEIIEIPNSCGNHSSPFITPSTEYVIAGTRFSVPVENRDVPINSYKENFRGTISFIKVDKDKGDLSIAFQLIMPPYDYDLSHSGKGPSNGWFFCVSFRFSTFYNDPNMQERTCQDGGDTDDNFYYSGCCVGDFVHAGCSIREYGLGAV